MPNYIDVISNCFPTAEIYIKDNLDPTVYANVVWITTPIDQATLDASDCVVSPTTFGANDVTFVDAFGQVLVEEFSKSSSAKNTWLSHNGQSNDKEPALMPFNGKIVGITFGNEKDDVETDLEIYVTPKDSNNAVLKYVWEIRDAKRGFNTNIPEIVFEMGSKIGIYFRKVGKKYPKKVGVSIYTQVISAAPTIHIENN